MNPFRLARNLPFFRLLAIVQVAMLAREHLQGLTPDDRRRLLTLARNGRNLTPAEKAEVRELAAKLRPQAFAMAAARKVSPFGMPGRRR